jgi:membrane protease YdiL (CAAX protease family)
METPALKRTPPPPFTSRLNKREAIMVLLYLPIHLVLLQLGLTALIERGVLPQGRATLLYYVVGFVYMVLCGFGFLRRDFDPLADAPFLCVREIMRCYLLMLGFNLLLGLLLLLLPEAENPNNAHIIEVVQQDTRMMKAAVIYLAPVVEEMLFRAGIFGLLRRKSRLAAYLVSALGFALMHVAPYALIQPLYWFFILQYIPASLLLARCYERTNSIWCSIFFHMLVNGVSLSALNTIG